jgi:hypothetical protein
VHIVRHELVLPSRAGFIQRRSAAARSSVLLFPAPSGAAVQALASATPLQAELSDCGARQLAVP